MKGLLIHIAKQQ